MTEENQSYETIVIEKDYLPSKEIELKFERFKKGGKTYYKPNLVFARNGIGKTTLAREVIRKYADDFNVFVFGEMFKPSFTKLGVEEVATLVVEDSDKTYFLKTGEIKKLDDLIKERETLLRNDIAQILTGAKKRSDTLLYRLQLFLPSLGYYTQRNGLFLSAENNSVSVHNIEVKYILDAFKKIQEKTFYPKLEKRYSEFAYILESSSNYSLKHIVREEFKNLIKEEIAELSEVSYGAMEELARKTKSVYTKSGYKNLKDYITSSENNLKKWNDEKESLIRKTAIGEYSKDLNRQLSCIFYENQRIHIDNELGKLSSRNNPILFDALSTAEKNILSLCYFFLKVKQEVQTNPSEPTLIIFDDPIASTDFDNKIGMYSLFRQEIEKLIKINSDIRLIILTHDEDVYYNFYKVFDDMPLHKNQVLTSEITVNGLIERHKEFNFYKNFINDTYRYALGLAPELDSYIGNIMRRVLEAYSMFNYNLGPSELTTNEDVLSKIPNEQEKEFFDGYMYRLILNKDSHASDRVKRASTTFSKMFSTEEKTRAAKLLLGLLYRLDPVHIKRMIDVDTSDEEGKLKIAKKELDGFISKQSNNPHIPDFDEKKKQYADKVIECKKKLEDKEESVGTNIENWLTEITAQPKI